MLRRLVEQPPDAIAQQRVAVHTTAPLERYENQRVVSHQAVERRALEGAVKPNRLVTLDARRRIARSHHSPTADGTLEQVCKR